MVTTDNEDRNHVMFLLVGGIIIVTSFIAMKACKILFLIMALIGTLIIIATYISWAYKVEIRK